MSNIIPKRVNIENCYIQPIEPQKYLPKDISSDERKEDTDKALGCFIWLIIVVVGYVILNKIELPDDISGLIWITPPIMAIIISVYVLFAIRDERSKKIAVERNKQSIKSAQDKANYDSESARNEYNRSFENYKKLQGIISSISGTIQKANSEYNSNAYSLYWDNIEKTVSLFAEFQNQLQYLTWEAENYRKLLSDNRNHNFPEFPFNDKNMPDIQPSLMNFKNAVRLGQTNFEFASIWEQRKTREVLVMGFKTVEEAVKNIEPTLNKFLIEASEILRKSR